MTKVMSWPLKLNLVWSNLDYSRYIVIFVNRMRI